MIRAVLIFNTHGKPRLSKFFVPLPPLIQQSLIAQIFSLISDRPAGVCNFLDAPDLVFPSLNPDGTVRSATPGSGSGNGNISGSGTGTGGSKGKGRAGDGVEMREDDTRVIYRHYATLYFVFVVDGAESELGILDLIQVFVEGLDRAFENVHHVLAEIIQGGLVLETNINEISACGILAKPKGLSGIRQSSHTLRFRRGTFGP
ncbi:Sigma-adaptin 3A [Saitozyma podzolica]|uniref:AP complex subunit sigma n=1 Tax=Saitozyma podzolica TaxID=1890683 RepID=A0A427YVH7_9TREE|nr:Sigma-adaptin 3A [Saitozyma podzolica]